MRQSSGRLALAVAVLIGGPAMARELNLSRPVRPWEFLCAVGQRAGLFGNESGRVEAWVYPLKILRDFRLEFRFEDRVIPAEALARTIEARPEATTITYSNDTFRVRETFFVPVKEQGAVLLLDVDTEAPLEIQASFRRDFQLEWPAALGGTFSYWNGAQHAFYFGEEQRKFAALVGSPSGVAESGEYQTNYSESPTNSFRLGVTAKGHDQKVIVIAGSLNGASELDEIYRRLSANYQALLSESSDYYRKYLARTVSLTLPDKQLETAYDWARISVVEGLVSNPFLGTGLVAGYRTSGASQRPGFAWYFGRDSFWTSLALNSAGDFATSRAALEFIAKYQRADGKIPHEISQGASWVPWFEKFPYAYASADATPLYLIAMDDYVLHSGDLELAREKWGSLWKAYQFLRSTYDEQQFPKNYGVGHGWVEGGPLLPVKTEFYQTAVGVQALRALGELARMLGKTDVSLEMSQSFERQRERMNLSFWIAEQKRFAFAIDNNNQPVDEPSVLATVPMWFGLVDEGKASGTVAALAGEDLQSDWGMRIISERSPKYSGGGYHYGSVWPLFTGWASVGEYKYHHAQSAFQNLVANALLALDGSPGHVTEVLSGDYYQPLSTSSPHQIWSAAMVVSPILRGLLGLEENAVEHRLILAPHLPADWPGFEIENAPCGHNTIAIRYARTTREITVEARTTGSEECELELRPAVSLAAQVLHADLNGRSIPFEVQASLADQHVRVQVKVSSGALKLRIALKRDFAVSVRQALPALGSESEGLRIVSERWSSDKQELTLAFRGLAGREYLLQVSDGKEIQSLLGAGATVSGNQIRVRLPEAQDRYAKAELVVRFGQDPRAPRK
jgi:glycogen debranching enzyme